MLQNSSQNNTNTCITFLQNLISKMATYLAKITLQEYSLHTQLMLKPPLIHTLYVRYTDQ